MSKIFFFRGILAGLLAGLAGIIYSRIYFFAFEVNFSKLINIPGIIAANLLVCLIAAGGFAAFRSFFPRRGEIIFNFCFSILSFASIVIPLAMKLPLDIQNPELFPGLAIPMHFFPALAWFTVGPIFKVDQ